jgi:hypothetical protein
VLEDRDVAHAENSPGGAEGIPFTVSPFEQVVIQRGMQRIEDAGDAAILALVALIARAVPAIAD